MAYITGMPNFTGATNAVAADFNNAAKAILSQIGGRYYDEAAAAHVTALGNLDQLNIASAASFKNSQKAEPVSMFQIAARGQVQGGLSAALFPPMVISGRLYAVSVAFAGDAASGGTVSIVQNGTQIATVTLNAQLGGANFGAYGLFNTLVSPGDVLIVDLTNVTWNLGAAAAPFTESSVGLYGTTLHCR